MHRDDSIRRIMECSLHELDRSLGKRRAGTVISGSRRLTYKDVVTGENPLHLTMRVMVLPLMKDLGYGRLTSSDMEDGAIPGTVMTVIMMNSDLSSASEQTVKAVRSENASVGIATDGFRWVLVRRSEKGARVRAVSDLRPYYID